MRTDINTVGRVWKEGREWWAQTFDKGRCNWLAGPFKSSRKAQIAAEESRYETCQSCFGAGASKHGHWCKRCDGQGKIRK